MNKKLITIMSDPNLVLNTLRNSATAEQAIATYATKKNVSTEEGALLFATEILKTGGLSRQDFSKLVELDKAIIHMSPETSHKLYKLCIDLHLHGLESKEIEELSKKLDLIGQMGLLNQAIYKSYQVVKRVVFGKEQVVDPLAYNELRMLQYLDLVQPGAYSNRRVILACIELATNTKIRHQVLRRDLQRSLLRDRKEVLLRFAELIKQSPSALDNVEVNLIAALTDIESIPFEDRNELIELANPYLSHITDGSVKADLLQMIYLLPKERRTKEGIEEIVKLFSSMDSEIRESIYEIMIVIPPENRTIESMKACVELDKEVTNPLIASGMREVLELLPVRERTVENLKEIASLLKRVIPETLGNSNKEAASIVQRTLNQVRADLRSMVLLRKITSLYAYSDLAQQSPNTQKAAQRNDQRELLFKAIAELPDEAKISAITNAANNLAEIQDGHVRAYLVELIGLLPDQNRTDEKLLSIVAILNDPKYGHLRKWIVNAMQQIPREERSAENFAKIADLFLQIHNAPRVQFLLLTFGKLAPLERNIAALESMATILFLSQARVPRDNNYYDVLHNAFLVLPEEKRTLKALESIITVFDTFPNPNLRLLIARGVSTVPGAKRESADFARIAALFLKVYDHITSLPKGIEPKDYNPNMLKAYTAHAENALLECFKIMALLPEEERTEETFLEITSLFIGISESAQLGIGKDLATVKRQIEEAQSTQEDIRNTINLLPLTLRNRENIAKIAKIHVEISQEPTRESLNAMFLLLPAEQRTLEALQTLSKSIKALPPAVLSNYIAVLKLLPKQGNLAQTFQEVATLMIHVVDVPTQNWIVNLLKKLPPERRTKEALENLIFLLNKVVASGEITKVLEKATPVPLAAMIQAAKLLKDVKDGYTRALILEVLRHLPKESYNEETIEALIELFKEPSHDRYESVFQALEMIPIEARADSLVKLYKGLKEAKQLKTNSYSKAVLLGMIGFMPPSLCSPIDIQKLIKAYKYVHEDRTQILSYIPLLLEEDRNMDAMISLTAFLDKTENKVIKTALEKIPLNERADILIAIRSKMTEEIPEYITATVIETLGLLPVESRTPEIAQKILALYENANSEECEDIIAALGLVAQTELSQMIDEITEHFKEEIFHKKSIFIWIMQLFPSPRSTETIQKIETLLQKLKTAPTEPFVALEKIEKSSRLEVFDHVLSMYPEVQDGKELRDFIALTDLLPHKMGDEAFQQKISSFVHLFPSSKKRECVIEILRLLPNDNRLAILSKLPPHFPGENENAFGDIVTAISLIPEKERVAFIESTLFPLFVSEHEFLISKNSNFNLLKVIALLPDDLRTPETYNQGIVPLNTLQKEKLDLLIKALLLLPERERTLNNLQKLRGLLEGMSLERGIFFINILSSMPKDQVNIARLEDTIEVLGQAHTVDIERALLQILQNMPREERTLSAISSVILTLSKLRTLSIADLVQCFRFVPKNECNAKLIQNLALMLDHLNKPMERGDASQMISIIPPKERSRVITELSSLLNSLKTYNERAEVLFTILVLDPKDQKEAIRILEAAIQEGRLHPNLDNALAYLYNYGDKSLKTRSYAYLETQLSLPDRDLAGTFAAMITSHQARLLLHSEHPLFQRAIEIAALTDPEFERDPKNPYRVYKSLLGQEPTLSRYTPPSENVCGEMVHFDPRGCQSLSIKCSLKPKFQDLPSDVHPDSLQLIFADIDAHLRSLRGEDHRKFNDEIQFGSTYENSKRIMLTGYIPSLLQVTGPDEEIVPLPSALFFAIARHILKQSPNRRAPHELSPREEVLLSRATFFNACQEGVEEAIGRTYHTHLPKEDRIYTQAEESMDDDVAENLVHGEIQKILFPLFSEENAFTKEVTDTPQNTPINQLPHQAIYLKNRIGMRMGLDFSLKFDPHTGTIATGLFHKNDEALLDNVYQHFRPSIAVQRVQNAVNHKYQELKVEDARRQEAWEQDTSSTKPRKPPESLAKKFYNQLNHYADKIPGHPPLWELDEESFEVTGCSEEGALVLLKAAGCIV